MLISVITVITVVFFAICNAKALSHGSPVIEALWAPTEVHHHPCLQAINHWIHNTSLFLVPTFAGVSINNDRMFSVIAAQSCKGASKYASSNQTQKKQRVEDLGKKNIYCVRKNKFSGFATFRIWVDFEQNNQAIHWLRRDMATDPLLGLMKLCTPFFAFLLSLHPPQRKNMFASMQEDWRINALAPVALVTLRPESSSWMPPKFPQALWSEIKTH